MNEAAKKTLRWGLLGAGDIAVKRVIPALKSVDGAEPFAINRQNRQILPQFAKSHGFSKWYEKWEDLVKDPSIDCVYIATPVYLHAVQTLLALEHGKHILCEKPMAMDRKEGQRMIDAARNNGLKLGVAYYRRFYPVAARIKSLIDSGAIGQAVFVQVNNFEQFDRAPGEPRYWLLEPEKSGGGPMMDMGCHRLDLLFHLFNPKVRDVRGLLENVRFQRAVEDVSTVQFRFEKGPVVSVHSIHAAAEPKDTLDIYGTKGSLHVENLNAGKMRLFLDGASSYEEIPSANNVHEPLVQDFVEAVLEDRDPIVTGEAALRTTMLLDEIYQRK